MQCNWKHECFDYVLTILFSQQFSWCLVKDNKVPSEGNGSSQNRVTQVSSQVGGLNLGGFMQSHQGAIGEN